MKKLTGFENDTALAKFISIVIRNAMEEFHVQHLSDEQMKELDPIIRDAVFTALHALRHVGESAGARAFVKIQSLLIPGSWEDPMLLKDYVATLEFKNAGEKLDWLRSLASHSKVLQSSMSDQDAFGPEPSAHKTRLTNLRVGGKYLHRNKCFFRIIEAIDGNTVCWRDQMGSGQCARGTFVKQCPWLAPE